jgi:hypothetical protein
MNYENHYNESIKIRQNFWNNIGSLHKDVLSHLINPTFMGGPSWPSTRQAFVVIDTPQGTIIASDGLSDPYSDFDTNPDNQAYNGIGCEFYIECDEKIDFEDIKNSWQFSVLYQAAQLGAGNPNIAGIFDEYGYVSTELYNCDIPQEFISEEERCGVLLNLPSKRIEKRLQLSLENIRMINVKLLTLDELKYINEKQIEGRNEVAERILNQEKPSISFLERKSVV